jgi:hypothetical protein
LGGLLASRRDRIALVTGTWAIVVVAVVVLGQLTISQGPATSPVPSAAASASAAASPSPSPSATATPPPLGSTIGERVGAWNDAAVSFGLAVLTWLVLLPLAVIVGSWIVVAVVRRVARAIDRDQLVVLDLGDATGDDEIKSAITGLSYALRERIHEASDQLVKDLKADRSRHDKGELLDAPPPRRAADTELSDLVTALKDSAPDQAKSVLGAVAAVLPRRGKQVTPILQRLGQPPYRVGLSVEITDLGDPARTRLESLDGAAAPSPAGESRTGTNVLENLVKAVDRIALGHGEQEPPAPNVVEKSDETASLRVRAETFVQAGAEWLAVLLFEETWLRAPAPGEGGTIEEELARIRNLLGIRYAELASWPEVHSAPMYLAARRSFHLAQDQLPDWYLSYKNEADTVSYLGAERRSRALQREARGLYALALQRATFGDGSRRTGYLSDQSAKLSEPVRVELNRVTRLEISFSSAICLVLLGDVSAADAEVSGARAEQPRAEADESGTILYTLACFEARAYEATHEKPRRDEAIRLLALGLARDPTLVSGASADPDLVAIGPQVAALVEAVDWDRIDILDDTEREQVVRDVITAALKAP